ncbi:MAG: hypothetical protein HZA37_01200 [Parcubacteria group bacterium]|nr:hypothetical protein [Parcubacteria group bacterium]
MIRAIHLALAIAQPMLAFAAVILVQRLIKRGLSHRLFRSLYVFFVLIFVLTLWHLADDIFDLKTKMGEAYEFPSYALLMAAFVYVISTATQALKAANSRTNFPST